MIISRNPTSEEILAEFNSWTHVEVDAAVRRAVDVQQEWRKFSLERRADCLRGVASLLGDRRDRYAALITLEMGKPIAEAEAEIEKCAWLCHHYADHVGEYLARERVETESLESYVTFEPIGLVLAIMPWNFPFWQVFRAAVPTLMAGNGVVLKHASNVPQCALAVEALLAEVLPKGLVRAVFVEGEMTEGLIGHPGIAGVTVTGSSHVGARVAAIAGARLKKQVLELGGSDPFIVLDDADVGFAADMAVRARYQNNGQSCIAAKRLIVVERVADEFTARISDTARTLHVGDPLDRAINIGPLARGDLRDALDRQVRVSREMGAAVLAGGSPVGERGYFYAPTVLAEVTNRMPAFLEETFGPVAVVVRARDVEDAIRIANDSPYGLAASLWTRDLELAKAVAPRIQAGSVFINGIVTSDPRMPIGGMKQSGYGRELGRYGLLEFTNIQTVRVNPPSRPSAPSDSRGR